jgi:hypothetical protein
LTNTIAIKNTENKKELRDINFPSAFADQKSNSKVIDMNLAKETLTKTIKKNSSTYEGNIIRFHVFMECFWSGNPEWKRRALVLLIDMRACLFWEKTLHRRKLLDEGAISGYDYKYQQLLAENDQEQCRSNFQMYLMKSVRAACALNAELKNSMGEYFITRKIKRSDEYVPYNYDFTDSLKMVHDFEKSFDDNWGGGASLSEIRWDLRLKAHNAEQAELAAA